MKHVLRMLALWLVTSSVWAVTCPTFTAGMTGYIAALNQLSAGCAPTGGGVGGSPLTTKGDIFTYSTVDARLAVGANGSFLKAASGQTTGLQWSTLAVSDIASGLGTGNATALAVNVGSTGSFNPMTTAGDTIIGGASGSPTRLAAGSTSGHVLTSNGAGAAPSWQAGGGFTFRGASAYSSVTQNIASATWVSLTLDTESYDTNTYHSTAMNTSRFTVPASGAGKFSGACSTFIAANATGVRYVRFLVNGTTGVPGSIIYVDAANQGANVVLPLTGVTLADADYIECQVYQNSGSTLTAGSGSLGTNSSTVTIYRID